MIEIFNEDCMIGMARYPDKYFDIILTSPPYNLGDNHHTGGRRFSPYNDNMPENKYQEWQINVINECYRVLKDTGSLLYNHKNRIKNGASITPYEWILKTKFILKQEIIWFNGSQNFDKIRFYPMTERVYWLAKLSETKLNNAISHHDLFQWQAEGTNKQHKRAFPVKMCEDLLSCFPEGENVLDIFAGSGSVGIACHNLNRNFTGFELDKDYFDASMKRMEEHFKQERMF